MMKFGPGGIQPRTVLAIAALGVAGSCGVVACASAGPASSQPSPATSQLTPLAASASNDAVARYIARIAAGNGGVRALYNGSGQATMVYCDPSTVSDRLHAGTPVSASCGVNYSDGSVWRQTVTVTFDRRGTPAAARANLGTEVLQPAGG